MCVQWGFPLRQRAGRNVRLSLGKCLSMGWGGHGKARLGCLANAQKQSMFDLGCMPAKWECQVHTAITSKVSWNVKSSSKMER